MATPEGSIENFRRRASADRAPPSAKPSTACLWPGAMLGLQANSRRVDRLSKNIDLAELVVLELSLVNDICNAFDEKSIALEVDRLFDANQEDLYDHHAASLCSRPTGACCSRLQANAKLPTIGKQSVDAMVDVDRANTTLKRVASEDRARRALDKDRLVEISELGGTIDLAENEKCAREVRAREYEYFLGPFTWGRGKNDGRFSTRHDAVPVLLETLAPYTTSVFEPCGGWAATFVPSERFLDARIVDLSLSGQESSHIRWRLPSVTHAPRGFDPCLNESAWGAKRLREELLWTQGNPAEVLLGEIQNNFAMRTPEVCS